MVYGLRLIHKNRLFNLKLSNELWLNDMIRNINCVSDDSYRHRIIELNNEYVSQ